MVCGEWLHATAAGRPRFRKPDTMTATRETFQPGQTTDAPFPAFRWEAGPVRFAADDDGGERTKPVKILARTGAALEHWYWGRIVHDFAGLQAKAVVPLDWCHDGEELIGKADRLTVDESGLWAEGTLESLEPGDQADKIIRRAGRGIPYEASIYFDPWDLELEYVAEGFVAEANGEPVEGPAVIARRWRLRRIAICPSGYDAGTQTNLSAADDDAARFTLKWNDAMSRKAAATAKPTDNATDNAAELAADTAAAPADDQAVALNTEATTKPNNEPPAKSDFEAKLDRFVLRFGAVDGLAYFQAGLDYTDALERHVAKLEATATAAHETAKAAADKLAAVNLGESSAVDTGAPGDAAPGPGSFGDNFRAAMTRSRK